MDLNHTMQSLCCHRYRYGRLKLRNNFPATCTQISERAQHPVAPVQHKFSSRSGCKVLNHRLRDVQLKLSKCRISFAPQAQNVLYVLVVHKVFLNQNLHRVTHFTMTNQPGMIKVQRSGYHLLVKYLIQARSIYSVLHDYWHPL